MTSPDIKTTILVVLTVASIRERLLMEYPQKQQELEKEIEFYSIQKEELKALSIDLQSAKNPKTAFAAITHRHELGSLP